MPCTPYGLRLDAVDPMGTEAGYQVPVQCAVPGLAVRPGGSHEASGDLHHSRAATYFFRPFMP
jgi:hypothetical protein